MTMDEPSRPRGRPPGPARYLEGEQVGAFTVFERLPSRIRLRCDHGHEREVSITNIRAVGKCRICCGGREASDAKARFANLCHGAVKRQLPVTLSVEEASELMKSNCTYCGAPPDPFNGIDRVDNAYGYIQGNVTAACTTCNVAKRTMSVDEFKDWIVQVYQHLELSP